MTTKAILFGSDFDDPAPFQALCAREFPALDFRVWPAAGRIEDIEYALIWKIDDGVLGTLPNLKAILALGAGVDQILKDPAFPTHVPLYRLIDAGLAVQMSEYAIHAVLDIHRRMADYRAQQLRRQWLRLAPIDPSECCVGVMGLGVLGAHLAQKLAALDFRTLGWSRTPKSLAGVECFHGRAGMAGFLAASEIMIVLLPLTPETQRHHRRSPLAPAAARSRDHQHRARTPPRRRRPPRRPRTRATSAAPSSTSSTTSRSAARIRSGPIRASP